MRSIRWTLAAFAVAALAGTAMSQNYGGTSSDQPSQQGTSADTGNPESSNTGTPNAETPNTGTSNTGNVDTGANQTNPNAPAATNEENPSSSATTAKCHWWSMSKECRQQRQTQSGNSSTGSGPASR